MHRGNVGEIPHCPSSFGLEIVDLFLQVVAILGHDAFEHLDPLLQSIDLQ